MLQVTASCKKAHSKAKQILILIPLSKIEKKRMTG